MMLASNHEENAAILASNARIIAANHEDISEMRASNARTDRQLLEMQQQAAMDREQAEKDRQRGDKDREQADKDREQADKDRQQVEKDRQQIEKDREQAEKMHQEWSKHFDEQNERYEKEYQRREKERKEFNRQLAGISDRLGSLIEDMVAPNAPRIARTLFEGDEVLTSSIRVKRRHPSDPGLNIELDLLVVGRSHLLVGEAKSKVTVEKAMAFLEKMRSIPEYFPEFSGFTVLPLIASVGIESSLVAHLSRLRIYALAFGDETMEILNEGAF